MPLVPVTIIVSDETIPTPLPLEDTTVRVYSEDGTTFITQGTTDENGELVLDLEDLTTFWVRFFKTEWAFAPRLRISVDSGASSNSFDVSGQDLSGHPPAIVPELCRASGIVVGAHGAPFEGARFSFVATELPRVIGGRVRVASKVVTRSREWGYTEVELVRDGVYDATVEGYEDETIRIKVPDAGAVDITDLIWPYVATLRYDPVGPLSIAEAESTDVQLHVVLSSGVETPYDLDNDESRSAASYVSWTVEPAGVLSFTIDHDTDIMTISGLAAGTAVISATVKPDVEADRLPAPTRSLTELTITVT